MKKTIKLLISIIVITFVLGLIFACGVSNKLVKTSDNGNEIKELKKTEFIQVKYIVVGEGTDEVSVTYSNSQGGTEQKNNLKLNKDLTTIFKGTTTVTDFEGSDRFNCEIIAYYPTFPIDEFLYLSAQNLNSSGKITVEIIINDEYWKHSDSEGGYVIATVSGFYGSEN